jgi:hypothetical protein
MKVYSLYYKDNFVSAFSTREEAVSYGKIHYSQDSWDCDIVVEYLHKSPIYTAPYHITPNITPNTIPYTQPIITKVPNTSPNIWCGTQDNMGTVTATYKNTGEQNA